MPAVSMIGMGGAIPYPPIITTAVLPPGTQGVPYSFQLTAIAGVGALTWILVNDTGSTLSLSSSGLLSGTPSANGTFSLTVFVRDSLSVPSAPVGLTITLAPGSASSYYNGQPFTINGLNFGTKSRAITPWVDDYGQDGPGVISSQWDRYAPQGGTPTSSTMQNRAAPYTTPGGTVIAAPDQFISNFLAGTHNYSGGVDGNWLAFVAKIITAPTFPICIYASYWQMLSPDWNFVGTWNLKQQAYGAQTGIGDCIYLGVSPPITTNATTTVTLTTNDNNNNVSTLENPDRNGKSPTNVGFWGTEPSPLYVGSGNGVWVFREVEMCLDTTTGPSGHGYWNVWDNGVQILNYAGRTDNYASLATNRGFTIGPGVYSGQSGPPLVTPNNTVMTGRHIIDITATGVTGAVAKVLATDASTIAASTKKRYQPCNVWTNTQVAGPGFRQCDFPIGSTFWWQVISENGTVQTFGPNTVVAAFDFYISPTGSDSNPGTQASPWAITAINTKRATYAGKRVGILNGTYNIRSLIQALGGDGYIPALQMNGAGGTSSNPTIIQAVNRGLAIIDGGSPTVNNPMIGTSDGSTGWITLDGLKLINGGAKTVHFGLFSGSNLNIPGWVIQNCEITGQSCAGFASGGNFSCIELQGGLGAIVRNNYFHTNVGQAGPKSSDHFTSTIQWYCGNTLYEYNTVVDSPGLYGKESGNYGTTIRYNYIDVTGWGLTNGIQDFVGTTSTPTGFPTTVHHNVIIAAVNDMRPTLAFSTPLPDPFVCYNNTFVGLAPGPGQSCGPLVCPSAGNANYYNNIHYSSQSGDWQFMTMVVNGPGVMDYDLYFSTVPTYSYGTFSGVGSARGKSSTLAAWKALMTVACEAHAQDHVDPKFVSVGSTGASNYKLAAGSGAINTGSTTGLSSGSACDIGAWGNAAPTSIGSSLGPQ